MSNSLDIIKTKHCRKELQSQELLYTLFILLQKSNLQPWREKGAVQFEYDNTAK